MQWARSSTSLNLEYPRLDRPKLQVSFLHLSSFLSTEPLPDFAVLADNVTVVSFEAKCLGPGRSNEKCNVVGSPKAHALLLQTLARQ